jgi:hypothetical protein
MRAHLFLTATMHPLLHPLLIFRFLLFLVAMLSLTAGSAIYLVGGHFVGLLPMAAAVPVLGFLMITSQERLMAVDHVE